MRSTIIGSLPPSSALTGVSVSAARREDLLRGAIGAGELHEVDLVDERGAGLAHAVDDVEDVGAADLALPGLDDLAQAEGSDLRWLDDHGAAGDQRRDRVAEREDQREVPGRDHADDRDTAGTGP